MNNIRLNKVNIFHPLCCSSRWHFAVDIPPYISDSLAPTETACAPRRASLADDLPVKINIKLVNFTRNTIHDDMNHKSERRRENRLSAGGAERR